MNFRRSLLPFIYLLILWAAFAGYVCWTALRLPEKVATHFGAHGAANGWMTRSGHVEFTLILGLVIPALVVGIFAVMKRADGILNIPHKEYWLAPERRQATMDFIQRQGLWFAGLFILFLAGIHHSILVANTRLPVALPSSDIGWIAGGFFAATIVWALVFIGYFLRKSS